MKKLAAACVWALTVSLLVGLVATPASAGPYPPKKPTCNVSDTTISPGDQVTVSGKHWQAGSTVTITLQPEDIELATATVGRNHKFSVVVTIPADVEPGPHTIECSGLNRRGNPVVIVAAIQILGIVGGGAAAFTGSALNVPLWSVLIGALVVLGVALVILGRRRRRSVGTGSSASPHA
jgi:hypothetical protein